MPQHAASLKARSLHCAGAASARGAAGAAPEGGCAPAGGGRGGGQQSSGSEGGGGGCCSCGRREGRAKRGLRGGGSRGGRPQGAAGGDAGESSSAGDDVSTLREPLSPVVLKRASCLAFWVRGSIIRLCQQPYRLGRHFGVGGAIPRLGSREFTYTTKFGHLLHPPWCRCCRRRNYAGCSSERGTRIITSTQPAAQPPSCWRHRWPACRGSSPTCARRRHRCGRRSRLGLPGARRLSA